ncbi:DMT family transporter [Isoalcanivorax indicus]|uniref:DMT family transporter n=1 Tax=Isoalcanivorax indicus TaxID=2202653 RepID=UPI000DBA707F|nr:DMT family transporter [Isoalcanivorax indicus]
MSTVLAYITVVLVWATTPLAINWSAEAGAPIGSVWLRMLLATLVGMLLLRALGGRMVWHRQALRSYAAAVPGVFGAMGLSYAASLHVPSGLISVMFGLAPLISGLMMQALPGGVRLRAGHWVGCLLGLAGLALIFRDALVPGSTALRGVLMLLGAVICFCGSGLAVQRVAAGLPPLTQTLGALSLSLPCYAVLWLASGEPLTVPLSTRGLFAVAYLALFGSLLGFLCYFLILSRLSAATVALVTLITPVLALSLGMFLNNEQPGVGVLAGGGLIVVALGAYLYADRALWRRGYPKHSRS